MLSARSVCWSCVCLLSVFAVITAVGCGGASFVPVTGTVTLDGKPLAGAAVNFTPATAGQGQVAQGQTDESGKFTLSSVGGLGAVPGSYKIGVSKLEGAGAGSTLKGDSAKAAAGAAPHRNHAVGSGRRSDGRASRSTEVGCSGEVCESGSVRTHGRSEIGDGSDHPRTQIELMPGLELPI